MSRLIIKINNGNITNKSAVNVHEYVQIDNHNRMKFINVKWYRQRHFYSLVSSLTSCLVFAIFWSNVACCPPTYCCFSHTWLPFTRDRQNNGAFFLSAKELNSQRINLEHQHGRHFIVLGNQHGGCDVMCKHQYHYLVNGIIVNSKHFKTPTADSGTLRNVWDLD